MWLRYLFLLCGLLLVLCDDAAVSVEETVDDVEDDFDIWVHTPDTGNQESGESEDDDLNTEDENYEPADEDVNDGDVNDEDVNDGDVNDEDVNDEDVNDEDVNDEDVNDEDVNDEDVNDEDVNDEDVNVEAAEDRDKEQIQASTTLPETLQTVTVPQTKQTVNKRPDVSSNKKGHVTSKNKKGNRPARVSESQKSKSASNKAGTKNTKIIDNNQNNSISSSSREGTLRKKRLPPSSASPSIQLIIVVVGAVLACVLITGFIRWRVRKRLNDKKLGRMSENMAAYRSRMGLPKTSIMDTIYECECEDRLMALRAKNTDEIHDADDPLDGAKTREDELYCSHKFDQPPSMASNRHYDNYLSSSKSSKGEKEFDRAHGSKKQSTGHKRHHHSHKSRYSRHHRRKSHHKTSSHKTESISPTNEECTEETLDDINCSTSLLEQTETTEVKRAVADQEAATFIPEELTQRNPQQPRRAATGPVLTTWQSLSFNRDWVGRMWQEKHKVICISHVLRNTAATSNPDSEESPSGSQTSDEDTQIQPVEATPSVEHSMMATIQDHQNSRETVCRIDVDHSTDSTVIAIFNSEDVPENSSAQSGLNDQPVAETSTSGTACEVAEITIEADISQTSRRGSLPGFLSFSDYNEGPPEYQSLLDSEGYSNHSMPLGNIEPHRHHRRHRRKRPEGRERSNRHLYSRVEGVDSSHTDARDPSNPHSHEEQTPLTSDYKSHEIPSNHRLEPQSEDAPIETTPLCSPNSSEDPNISHHSFTNSPSSHTVSSVAASFVPQEGIVLEQLSDGAQIIYLPPPLLPSYHNDTPPPYHK